VQTVTSSIVYSSGSNIFGNLLNNTQTFTGSVNITGSLSLNNITIPTSASLASTYLQLAGGTLTGDLSIAYTTSNLRLFLNNTTATTGRSWYLNSFSNGNLYIGNTTASDIFNFSSAGAATFSSTITGTTIYGSTAVCSPVGKFTSCIDAGSGIFSSCVKSTRYLIAPSGVSSIYNFVDSDQLFAGSYNLQAGGGSSGYGGSLVMFGHSHATKPGYVVAGISAGSGGKFTVNNAGNGGGTELFTVDVNGVAAFSSTITGTTIYGSTAVCSAIGLFSGCVGIGTISPITRLQVIANTPTFLYSPGQLDVRTQESQAANKGAMISIGGNAIGNNTPYNFGIIGAYKTNSTSEDYSSYMIFGTSDVYSNVFERMRITTGGNVGIGTCSPTNQLHVVNSVKFDTGLYFNNSAANGAFVWQIANESLRFGTCDTERMRITNSGNVLIGTQTASNSTLQIVCVPSSYNGMIETVGCSAGTVKHFRVHKPGYVEYGIGILDTNSFHISTASTFPTANGFTISSGGCVGINCTAPSGLLTVGGDNNQIHVRGGYYASIYGFSGTQNIFGLYGNCFNTYLQARGGEGLYLGGQTSCNHIFLNSSGITCFAFTVCAPCFATISDYRMKSNIRPIEGLSIIMNTKPYKFEYNYDCSTSFGMIAHELQDTLPEAVFGQKDGEVMQGVDYMKLLPITIKAIQEQQCTINTLKTCLGIA
jgi:hypothetical protein